jgi:hypothetical protein
VAPTTKAAAGPPTRSRTEQHQHFEKKINFLLTTLSSACQKAPCCDLDGAGNAFKRSTRFLEEKGDFEVIQPGDRSTLVLREAQESGAYIVRMTYEPEFRSLTRISDDELLRRLSELLQQSRRVESELVAHIGEVDARRLYAREATPSMFVYCTEG